MRWRKGMILKTSFMIPISTQPLCWLYGRKHWPYLQLQGIIRGWSYNTNFGRLTSVQSHMYTNKRAEATTSYRRTGWVWKYPVEVQDFRKITHHFGRIYGIYLNSIKKIQKIEWNWEEFEGKCLGVVELVVNPCWCMDLQVCDVYHFLASSVWLQNILLT